MESPDEDVISFKHEVFGFGGGFGAAAAVALPGFVLTERPSRLR